MQRKLTQEELQDVENAVRYLRRVCNLGWYADSATVVLGGLDELARRGTTDGSPWVEPQPEIGEGYRVATKADTGRLDLDVVIDGRWVRTGPRVLDGFTYRVPVDRIPTDEDAKQRPTVMVSGNPADGWHARRLLGVTAMGFLVASGDGFTNWKQARFPYPGELP